MFQCKKKDLSFRQLDIMQSESSNDILINYRIREGVRDSLHKKCQINNWLFHLPRLHKMNEYFNVQEK